MVSSAHTTIAQLSSESSNHFAVFWFLVFVSLLFGSFPGPATLHSGILGSSQVTGTDQDGINRFMFFMGGGRRLPQTLYDGICRKEVLPLTQFNTMSFLLASMCGTCHSRTLKRGRSLTAQKIPKLDVLNKAAAFPQ